MKQSVIIVAGGVGSRMKSIIPKQFIEVYNKPLILYSIEKFMIFNPNIQIVVVLSKELIDKWQYYVEKFDILKNIEVTTGGDTRFQSVYNGLQLINDDFNGLVAVHDAARPLVTVDTIKRCFDTALVKGNAVPAISLNDSLRICENSNNFPIDRNKIRIIQTPQCFKLKIIKKAYQQEFKPEFTDDASVVETIGIKINLVDGNIENLKITTKADIKLFEFYLTYSTL